MSFNDCFQKAVDLLAKYEHMIGLSNDLAINNHAKTSEEVYSGLLNLLYPQRRYQTAGKVNEKGIDLFDPVSREAVQIKSRLGKSGIRDCVNKFSTTDWCKNKKYDLVILVTAEKCSVSEQEFEVEGYCYTNRLDSYLDNSRLLSLVNVRNCHQVLNYLQAAIVDPMHQGSSKTETTTNYNTGTVFQFSNSGDVSFNDTNFDLSSDNRNVTLTKTDSFQSAKSSYEKGLYNDSASKFKKLLDSSSEADINSSLYYVLSKVSGINIYDMTEIEIEKINEHIQHLSDTKHEELGNVIWLVVYFENVATRVPPAAVESLMQKKLSELDYLLPIENKAALNKIEIYTPESQEILRKIRYEY